ncbi:Scr1 family TA system antitoxin-like transcriptional regulator [Streptosporangium oxazolinicum]
MYLEKTPEVERYTLMFDHLRAAALPVEASRTLIAKIAAELDQ